MVVAPEMKQFYDYLAFVVALYFPVALVTWLVIDKFFVSGDAKAHAVRGKREPRPSAPILAEHPRHES